MGLHPGKLPASLMDSLLQQIRDQTTDSRVKIGPHMGQDTAIIDMGEKYLVAKSDPITFATESIGYYVVNVNANDIATSGARPRWFQSTILLPEKNTTEDLVVDIFGQISTECEKLGISIIGGHTEVSFGIDRPIIMGTMLGEVEKDHLVTTFGGKPGDKLILTKGIVLEGSSIIAHEKENDLLEDFSAETIEAAKNLLFTPGISVMKEALLVSENFHVHAMHDPTEGGLAMGVVEMARNSKCGVFLEYEAIPFIEPSKQLCEKFGLDPLSTITSGCLIMAVDPSDAFAVLELLASNGINGAIIGQFTNSPEKYVLKKAGQEIPLKFSEIDEITKIF